LRSDPPQNPPLFPVSPSQNGKQGYLNIGENKPVENLPGLWIWVAQRFQRCEKGWKIQRLQPLRYLN
jgi:hypothetical protein